MIKTPIAILYDSSGNPLAVQSGAAIPASTPRILIGGSDLSNNAATLNFGQRLMAASVSVVLASDHSTITIGGNKTNNNAAPGATNIGALTALANAAAPSWTEGNLVLLSTLLNGNLRIDNTSWLGSTAPSVGSKTSANSIPVVIASDQATVPISASSLPLPSGAATSSNQTTLGSQTTKINDGSNTAAVKAASTPASATDPALVVALSPNNSFTLVGNKTNNNAAPGATNIGALSAVANAAAPSWTEGNLVALSSLLNGNLRIDNTSWLGSAAPSVGSKTSANSIPIVIASDQAPGADRTASGSLTSTGSVSISTQNCTNLGVFVTGTWAGTIVFEVTIDGTNWFASRLYESGGNALQLFQSTTNCQGRMSIAGYQQARVRCSAYTSGTISINLEATQGSSVVRAVTEQLLAVDSNNASTANLAAGAVFTGAGSAVAGFSALAVNLRADQPCTVSVQQSPDGTNWDQNTTYTVNANAGDGRYIRITSSYYRVIVTNIGGSTTTFLRLQSVLVPIATPQDTIASGVGTGGWVPSTPSTYFNTTRGQTVPLSIGPDGTLQCYSEVLTDAGSFRDDFAGSSLVSNLTGTITFANGSNIVSGVGCKFTTELNRFSYIKGTAAAEGTYAPMLNVIDDNNGILSVPYAGATATGVGVVSSWDPSTGSGGSITVGSSLLSLVSGTTTSSNTWVQRGSDYGPMDLTFRISLTARNANQTVRIGFFDNFSSPNYQACVELTGTDNTKVSLVSRSSSSASDLETVTVTLPWSLTTAALINLRITVLPDRVVLYLDMADGSPPTFLAMTKNHIPPTYTSLLSGIGILNGTAPSTATLAVDMVYLNDYNLLQVQPQDPYSPDADVPSTTSVAAAVADTVLLVANKGRKIATIYNDSTALLYLKFGSGASTTSFTVRLASQAYYEVPNGMGNPGGTSRPYNGAINGYWAAANGNARVTEVT